MRGSHWLRHHLKSVWTGLRTLAGDIGGFGGPELCLWVLLGTLTQWAAAHSELEGPRMTQSGCQSTEVGGRGGL